MHLQLLIASLKNGDMLVLEALAMAEQKPLSERRISPYDKNFFFNRVMSLPANPLPYCVLTEIQPQFISSLLGRSSSDLAKRIALRNMIISVNHEFW
jgi:hypothetical protein